MESIATSLPESLACSTSMFDHPTFLQVYLLQFTAGDHVPNASAPHRTLAPISPTQLTLEHPPKSESHISMTAEVQKLLSCAMLDTSSQASESSTLKRLPSTALGDLSSPTVEDPLKLLDTSSQSSPWVATFDIAEPNDQTLLPTKTPEADAGALPKEVILLQEEMSRAMGCLLMTRASLDACQ